MKRSRWMRTGLLRAAMLGVLALVAAPALAADVITDGDMEAAGIGDWPHTNITGTNTSAKQIDFSASGQSLRGTSQAGRRIDVGWYNAQNVGTVNDTDTVLLGLWYGWRFNASIGGQANGTVYFDVKPSGGTWSNAWSQTLTPLTSFQSSSISAVDISTAFATPDSYDIRLRFEGQTGNDNGASVQIWWDDVIMDVAPQAATTTVGDGTDPGDASRCPGAVAGNAAELDAFTLSTSTGSDTVTAVQVTFAAGTAAGLSLVEITNDGGGTVYGSQGNPSDTQSITLTTPINVTTSAVQYKVRIRPLSHAAMPVPPGSEYAVTGTVTGITSTNTPVYNDTGSATVTVDNLSTANAGWGTITPGDGQVDLSWTNPGDADFAEVVILRNTATITDTPVEGQTYIAGNTIGTSDVVYAGTGTAFSDTGVSNGTAYWYEIFARDTCVNYATGAETGPHTPTAPGDTTTVGDGTDPTDASRCPGSGAGNAADLDAFTLQTSAGTDSVTALQVSFAGGTAAGLSLLEVTSDDGATVYGSQANPTDTQSVTLTTPITATTTLVQYRLRIRPKAHADMPVPPGSEYAVTGTVTGITATNTPVYNDADSATVTVDNLSTADATWGTVTAGDGQVDLAWTNPGDGDFAEVVILRGTSAIGDAPVEGQTYTAGNTIGATEVVYAGAGAAFSDTGVSNGTAYWYKIFARDTCVNYATGAQTGPYTPQAAQNPVVPDPATAAVDGCNQITVTASFTGDDNADSSTDFERGESGTGPWTTVCGAVTGTSPRSCVDTGVAESSSYWYQVTFTDPDGDDTTNAPNPQVIGPYLTPACTADDTTIESNDAGISSCKQITATGWFGGDADDDGSLLVEQGPSATGPWTTGCSAATGSSPRQCLIPELTAGSTYHVRFTYSDPDGVTGTNGEVLGPYSLPTCGADDAAPTALVVAPARDAVVSGVDRVKVEVHDGVGLAVASPVQWSLNGGALSDATENTNYSCGDGCSVWEFDLDTSALANDSHYLTIQVSDNESPANEAVVQWGFRSSNQSGQAAGSGQLLRRTHGSQLCSDCHNLTTHSSATTSGKYGNWAIDCQTCHTPHRTTNIFLVDETVRTPNSGQHSVLFHYDDRAGETNPGSAPGNYSFVGDRSGADNAPYDDGICETCHTRTKYWRNDTSGTNNHSHNEDMRCLKCHTHDNGFFGGGGGCLGCHETEVQEGRRAVGADFSKNSHHVGTGGTMGGTLTDFDCVVCHAEGEVNGDETGTTSYHMNQVIDLRDTDDDGTGAVVYAYDKDAITNDGGIGGPGDWHSGNAEWRSQTSTALDPFCLTCHDTDGAAGTYAREPDGGGGFLGSALNPFADDLITNNYDLQTRGAGIGRVVDIASMVSGSPPPQGQFARHAIRGQSSSIYELYEAITGGNTMYEGDGEGNLFTSMGTDEFAEPVWNDTSLMGCADCHTTDGANTTSGNAHGSDSEYLLKDASGLATEGDFNEQVPTLTYNCYRCHSSERYRHNGTQDSHTGNASDYVHTSNQTGSLRNDNNGNIFGMACTNCHGGTAWGAIHGTSEVFNVGEDGGGVGGTTTRNAYRFMNGASLRFYYPNGWSGTSVTCYTLSSNTTPDAWGSCTKHNKGTGFTKPLQRPLSY